MKRPFKILLTVDGTINIEDEQVARRQVDELRDYLVSIITDALQGKPLINVVVN